MPVSLTFAGDVPGHQSSAANGCFSNFGRSPSSRFMPAVAAARCYSGVVALAQSHLTMLFAPDSAVRRPCDIDPGALYLPRLLPKWGPGE